jgi:hypothetical protein
MFESIVLIATACIYFNLNYLILNLVNQNVIKPYMDEIFHVPQAQTYCLGNYNEVSKPFIKKIFYYKMLAPINTVYNPYCNLIYFLSGMTK